MSELLRGVDLSKTDRKMLTKIVKSMNLECDTSIDSMVASLSDQLIKKHKATPAELLRCDWCGGSSDISFEKCPYCGLTDDETTAKLAEEAAKAPPPAPEEKPAVNAKPPKKTRSQATNPVAAAAPKAGPGVKKTTTSTTAITKPAKVHKGEIVTAAVLDDLVAEIKRIQVDIADNHWLLGQKISEVHDKNLFKLRLDEKGKPRYANFGQWVVAEIEFGVRYALDLAAVSKVFTEAEIKEVGVTKLRVLARIPEEAKRANLVAKAKGELTGKPLTRNELEAEAKKGGVLPARPAIDGRQNTDEGVAKRAEKAAARAAAKGVAVVLQPGRITVPLFSGLRAKELEPMRAFDLGDEPFGLEDTLNGLKIRYYVEKDAEGLSLVIERTREE